jgi:hypothetical protein
MALKGRLTSTASNRTLSMRKFSGVPNVTGSEIQPCGMTGTRPTPENGHDGWSFDIKICSLLKVARLMRLSAAPPSTRMWYSLILAMVGETCSESCLAPTMLLGQLVALKLIGVSIHVWCGATLGVGATTATSQRRVLTTLQEVVSQEPPNMTYSILRCFLSLDSESEWA